MPSAAASTSSSTGGSAESQTAGKPFLLYAVIALAVLNGGFLIGLALFASAPIVLNPSQIRASSLIVTGSPDTDDRRGVTVKIEETWKGIADTDTVFVRDLTAAQLKGSDVWIFPLSQFSPTEYVVTPRKNAAPATAPLLYPARPEMINKLKSLLSPADSSP